MATSGAYTVTTTGATVIKSAMRKLGVLASGETPTTNEYADAMEALNDLIFQWKGPPNFLMPGEKMWQTETASLTLDSTKTSYSLRPSGGELAIQVPVEIISVNLKNISTSDEIELAPMQLGEYLAIASKSATGKPERYYYEKRLAEGELYFDMVVTAAVASAYTATIVYRQPLEIISATTQEFDIEDFYLRALKWNLAVELAPEYGVPVSSELSALATQSLSLAQTFHPDNAPSDAYFQSEID